jgi:hypothetical protein
MTYRRKTRLTPVVDKTLSVTRNYLLGRIPGMHELKTTVTLEEPTSVKLARKIVAAFEKRERLANCKQRKLVEALRIKAREAVYFCSEQTALNLIHRLEAMKERCED